MSSQTTTPWWQEEITLPAWGWFLIAIAVTATHDLIKWAVTSMVFHG